jgi:hypothetical protein
MHLWVEPAGRERKSANVEQKTVTLIYPYPKQNMTSLRGQASGAKMMSPGGKLTALACYPTKNVDKAE